LPIIKFEREIRQTGGSLAITLPPEIAKSLGWKLRDKVHIYVDDEHVIIERVKKTSG